MAGFFSGLFGGKSKVDISRRFDRLHESISGTMSTFYKARDRTTGGVVGLKIVDPKKCDPIENRYKGLGKPPEGQIGSQIDSPGVAKTLEWGTTTDGRPFIVQEFVEGTMLHSLISAKKPLPPAKRIDLVRQAATAIAAVHRSGFVHRDICPRNFVLRPDGRLVLIDFGLAVPEKPVFLQPGNRIGTPNYMAPEVVRRKQADKRLDVFSFGVTAYEICTLDLPWPRGSSGHAAMSHDSPPTPLLERWPEAPESLAKAIMSCLDAEPARRPESLEKFLGLIAKVTV
jgi:serine/threonine protein kinase